MRRLLLLEALLNTDQEIPGAFSGNPKLHSDDFEWFGLMHVFYLGGIVAPDPPLPMVAPSADGITLALLGTAALPDTCTWRTVSGRAGVGRGAAFARDE